MAKNRRLFDLALCPENRKDLPKKQEPAWEDKKDQGNSNLIIRGESFHKLSSAVSLAENNVPITITKGLPYQTCQ